ncbi:MAG: hypothetical protein GEU73_00455 [Chloroflexi bacterium]|nr:hypothetical protein [Chloroflexota bacterium]
MKYATATAFRTALERRLLTTARDAGVPLVRLRKLVVFDRLMARLLVVGSGRWTLKGAVALHLRLGMQFRTTMDMDLARHDTEAAVRADFLAAESLEIDDYFTFTTRQVRPPGPSDQAGVVRYHVTAQLAGAVRGRHRGYQSRRPCHRRARSVARPEPSRLCRHRSDSGSDATARAAYRG